VATLKAAFKAFTFNKVSDVSILVAIMLVYSVMQDTSVINLNNEISLYTNYYLSLLNVNVSYIELLSFFLITAAFIKSAQFGSHI
jgi:NADH:ubiquinone oxidoreductase subunit 5 (subunit L)/multisubunit Na+/H+ antiporter MnhA subunit